MGGREGPTWNHIVAIVSLVIAVDDFLEIVREGGREGGREGWMVRGRKGGIEGGRQ